MNAKSTPLRCLVMVLAFLESASAIGAENTLACEPDPIPLLERQHDHMSRLIEATLRGADSLFSGNRSYDAPTGSYVQIIVSTLQQRARDGRSQYDLVPRAKINLPKTNERIQLFLEQDLPNAGRSEAQRDAQAAAGIQPHDLSEYLGLRGIAAEKLKLQLTADGGVRMRVMPDPFARARARRVFSVGPWSIPLSETILYRRSDKASATSELGFIRTLTNHTALTLSSGAVWRQPTHGFDLSQYATITYQPNTRMLFASEVGVYGHSRPDPRVTAYSAALRYRRKIYRDWMVMEVRPQLIYTRDSGFRPIPSITLQIEAFFGDRYFEYLQ
jgi:hypothetical protein